jgi:hypothetical protein
MIISIDYIGKFEEGPLLELLGFHFVVPFIWVSVDLVDVRNTELLAKQPYHLSPKPQAPVADDNRRFFAAHWLTLHFYNLMIMSGNQNTIRQSC